MCDDSTDSTDVNKAKSKDSYPLSNIDKLVDNALGYEYLNFMATYSGYNQIRMYFIYKEKTIFIIEQANFCYIVMPFSLKNTRGTYQHLMNKVFIDQISRVSNGWWSLRRPYRDLSQTLGIQHEAKFRKMCFWSLER